jgi:hypothetical protein
MGMLLEQCLDIIWSPFSKELKYVTKELEHASRYRHCYIKDFRRIYEAVEDI